VVENFSIQREAAELELVYRSCWDASEKNDHRGRG
jgi:hypothetical protein